GDPGGGGIWHGDAVVVAERRVGARPAFLVLGDPVRAFAQAFGIADGQPLALAESRIVAPVGDVAVEHLVGSRAAGVNAMLEIAVEDREQPRKIAPAAKALAHVAAVD